MCDPWHSEKSVPYYFFMLCIRYLYWHVIYICIFMYTPIILACFFFCFWCLYFHVYAHHIGMFLRIILILP